MSTEQLIYCSIPLIFLVVMQILIFKSAKDEMRNRKIFEKYMFESLNIIDKRVMPLNEPFITKKPKKGIVFEQSRNGQDEFDGSRDDFH